MISTVYLEAAAKTQELVTLKWQLRAAGFEVRSTWHDESAGSPLARLSRFRIEQMRKADALVVLSNQSADLPPELAALLGFAAGSGLPVFCVGPQAPVFDALADLGSIHFLANTEQLLRELARNARSQPLAA